MKHSVFYIITVLVTSFFMVSCKEDTPLPYDGMTGITFQPASMFTDRISVGSYDYPSESDTNFVKEYFFQNDTTDNEYRIFQIPVTVLGYTTDFDRPVSIEVDSTSTLPEGKYEIGTNLCVISGGMRSALLNIKVDRPDPKDLSPKKLIIKLVPNQYFSYVNGDGQYFTCNLYNKNQKPRYWDYSTLTGLTLTQYFGIYSNNKFDFIHETLYNYEETDYEYDDKGNEKEVITYPYRGYDNLDGFRALCGNMDLCTKIQDVLQKAYKDSGKHIYDENTGKEIRFTY